MTATNHTEHYGLSQYTDGDRPTYTGDYNGDMGRIDAAIYAASQSGGGMAAVGHTADLTGDGTANSPLGVAETIARTTDIPSLDGYATTEGVTQAIAEAIADRLTAGDIRPGDGIDIETSGNQVTIGYVGAGGLSAVAHDATLTGDGTAGKPLGAAMGSAVNQTYVFADGAFDLDNLTDSGIFALNDDRHAIANAPTDTFRGCVFVTNSGYPPSDTSSICQVALCRSRSGVVGMHTRALASGSWSAWTRMASMSDVPDVSALTSRIAALEDQVAALTATAAPGATGLTAAQLDSRYVDGYHIVRVGTPARSKESEESSNEQHQ